MAGDKSLEMTMNWQSNDDHFSAISSEEKIRRTLGILQLCHYSF